MDSTQTTTRPTSLVAPWRPGTPPGIAASDLAADLDSWSDWLCPCGHSGPLLQPQHVPGTNRWRLLVTCKACGHVEEA
jgi:hypothetical protein